MGRMGRGRPGLADGTMWDQEACLEVIAIRIVIKYWLVQQQQGELNETILEVVGLETDAARSSKLVSHGNETGHGVEVELIA